MRLILRSVKNIRKGWRSRKSIAILLGMIIIGLVGVGQFVGLVRDRMENAIFIQTRELVQPLQTPKKATPHKKPAGPQESPCYQLTPWGYS